MPLTPHEIAAAKSYLEMLPRQTVRRARQIVKDGAVVSLEEVGDGQFDAQVRGRFMYEPALFYDATEGWWGTCTCPVEDECTHCAAVVMALLDGRATGNKDAEKATAETGPAAEARKQTAKSPVAENSNEMERIVAKRLNRPLTVAERKTIGEFERFYLQNRNSTEVFESALAPLLLNPRLWGWDKYQIWPQPPSDAWEAWLYLAHWAKGRTARFPEFLLSVTKAGDIEPLVREWERRISITKWKDWLCAAQAQAEEVKQEVIELRVVLDPGRLIVEWRKDPTENFAEVKQTRFEEWLRGWPAGKVKFERNSLIMWKELYSVGYADLGCIHTNARGRTALNVLLRMDGLAGIVLSPARQPFRRSQERLRWKNEVRNSDYCFVLSRPDGSAPPKMLAAVDGHPALYVSHEEIFECDALHGLEPNPEIAATIPGIVMETPEGVALFERLELPIPAPIAKLVRRMRASVEFRCLLDEKDTLQVNVAADLGEARREELGPHGWTPLTAKKDSAQEIIIVDRSLQIAAEKALVLLRLDWDGAAKAWRKMIGKKFPEQWIEWVKDLPAGIEVKADAALASLTAEPVTARLALDIEGAGIDWFDVRVKLSVSDTELTQAELDLLLEARGGLVRLGGKGWRRLEYDVKPRDEERLADMGLNARELSMETQRLHALQLSGKSARALMGEKRAEEVNRRVEEIKTRVAPAQPAAIQAELRPYQREGFHFLAYLSANHFGGILADDMGLGKTVQTLTWIAWLREQADFDGKPVLVVCPKSVTDTWRSEAARFYPAARLRIFRAADELALAEAVREAEIIVLNYAQLRLAADEITRIEWHAVILDEAQNIKNPTSKTAQAAGALKSTRRLALSGTPIENRLLDLWSIMTFAMPGALGTRAGFNRSFDQKNDPLARRRLAARVRPFVLRRTKGEVATDLPERIEEDVFCEMEGEQGTLYRAELKRARQALLKIQTAKELDAQRFNILTSLLRLRQICCHPALVKAKAKDAESAKLTALLDLLEPLVEEGHKVLVFSQFVEMIELIQAELAERKWRSFVLTGQTEERGELVRAFQESEGSSIFLISLRAGGSGLNLTAASYVVLYDPWWNPAVENQAIDRTHRIGQTNRVVAYRLLVKESIEEKIRGLQKQKSVLAADILGEENFARALTLDDFKFLIGN